MFLSVNIVQCATDNRNSYRLSEHCKFPCFFLLIKMSLSKKITDPLTGFQSIGSNSNFLLLYRVENYLHREHFENNNGGLFALKMLNKPKYPETYLFIWECILIEICVLLQKLKFFRDTTQ